MISTSEFQKGIFIIFESQPWMIVDFEFVAPGKGAAFYRAKLKSLINNNTTERTFKSGERFEEIEIVKTKAKFLYAHRDKFFFAREADPSMRFEAEKETIGDEAIFLKANQIVDVIEYDGKIVSIALPIKVFLKVAEAPSGFKGDTAQGGTKVVILETGAEINVPLFIDQDEVIEINTQTGEYVRRAEEAMK